MIPQSWRHRFWTITGPTLQVMMARQVLAKPANKRPLQSNAPLVVAGLFSTANGIGEAARTTYRALRAAGLNPIAVDLSERFAPVDLKTDIKCEPMPRDRTGTLILQLNAPETLLAMQCLDMQRGREWYTIGVWSWELPQFPRHWESAFQFLSEVWAISSFSANALSQHRKAPRISVFGLAVSPPENVRQNRSRYGWSDNDFVFLTMADSMSSLERKNPFAVIRAFREAFGDAPNRKLLIKTRNLAKSEYAQTKLETEIGDSTNISILDVSLSEKEMWTLLNSVDALASFHRSEGFGLTLAEAMSLSKPVICTNWSGNTDFTTSASAALVDYQLVPCIDPFGVYSDKRSVWADVLHQHGVNALKKVAEDTDYRKTISDQARKQILAVANLEVIGSKMASHLSELQKDARMAKSTA